MGWGRRGSSTAAVGAGSSPSPAKIRRSAILPAPVKRSRFQRTGARRWPPRLTSRGPPEPNLPNRERMLVASWSSCCPASPAPPRHTKSDYRTVRDCAPRPPSRTVRSTPQHGLLLGQFLGQVISLVVGTLISSNSLFISWCARRTCNLSSAVNAGV
ncbi:hypothetical protein EDB80DRAFT_62764 [Ilyonectria destructans]|nr:hypothetical protein EDB80DRAFT_62764 [Ilyonectria destructans]